MRHMPQELYDFINAELQNFGLSVRGKVLTLENNEALFLIGSVGDEFFDYFKASEEYHLADDPLDKWSKRIIDSLAIKLSAEPVYPFDLPSPPFQRWAMASDDVSQSPLGILIHHEYGLWHAYRGGLKFKNLDYSEPAAFSKASSPCDECLAKPCLHACPVGAFTVGAYDTRACSSHLETGDSRACFALACVARKACPVASELSYKTETAQFFMQSFGRSLKKIS